MGVIRVTPRRSLRDAITEGNLKVIPHCTSQVSYGKILLHVTKVEAPSAGIHPSTDTTVDSTWKRNQMKVLNVGGLRWGCASE